MISNSTPIAKLASDAQRRYDSFILVFIMAVMGLEPMTSELLTDVSQIFGDSPASALPNRETKVDGKCWLM